LVGIELLGTLAELHPLKLADQVAQAIVLTGEPGVLSPLGIALGPCLKEQCMQRRDILGKGLGGRVHGAIRSSNR